MYFVNFLVYILPNLLEGMSGTDGNLTMHRGHLVVKHDSLGEILLQATEMSEARQVIFVA